LSETFWNFTLGGVRPVSFRKPLVRLAEENTYFAFFRKHCRTL